MKQYQVNNIVGALQSYLSARRNRGAATNLMQSMEQDPNMDAYERQAYANAFAPDYSNVGEVSGEYLGYRQKKKQMEMEAENQRLSRGIQAQNAKILDAYRRQQLIEKRKKARAAALKNLIGMKKDGLSFEDAQRYAEATGLGDTLEAPSFLGGGFEDEDEDEGLEGEDDMDVNAMFERLY